MKKKIESVVWSLPWNCRRNMNDELIFVSRYCLRSCLIGEDMEGMGSCIWKWWKERDRINGAQMTLSLSLSLSLSIDTISLSVEIVARNSFIQHPEMGGGGGSKLGRAFISSFRTNLFQRLHHRLRFVIEYFIHQSSRWSGNVRIDKNQTKEKQLTKQSVPFQWNQRPHNGSHFVDSFIFEGYEYRFKKKTLKRVRLFQSPLNDDQTATTICLSSVFFFHITH